MTHADRPRFGVIIAALSIATRGDIDTPTIELYFRALQDVPLNLLHQASIELAATSKWMPKPAEWREAVDELLDRRDRLKALDKGNQLALPGEIGDYICDDCGNSGWTIKAVACERGARCRVKNETHTHDVAVRCVQKYCVEARAQKAAAAKRYSRKD